MEPLLKEAIRLRNEREYEKSKSILIDLAKNTNNPEVYYQCAWTHDAMGLETEAVCYYEKAIKNGLKGESLCGAYIGLGSTYRCIGQYEKAIATLKAGLKEFPDNDVMKVFLSIAKYNLKEYEEAMKLLLETVSKLESIKEYEKPILYYKDHLNEIFK
ncbi:MULTISPECIES: tetratricopeptide repeat protein [unclassified Bacillus cereus group]|uniref:tetratricopeptide repeat protein n=1 Tax=unclassified Bacillus cereus group TaxID=2750818 RepID=UPI001F593812|nr:MULTISPECIES: tetratricopeptide repeat protein [unclassified Bacillus cereus group]